MKQSTLWKVAAFFTFATCKNFIGMFQKAADYGYDGHKIYVHDYLFELLISVYLWSRYYGLKKKEAKAMEQENLNESNECNECNESNESNESSNMTR